MLNQKYIKNRNIILEENYIPISILKNLKKKLKFPIPHYNELIQFLSKLFKHFNVNFIALYGSVVRKTYSYRSDLDIFIIASDFPNNIFERLDRLYSFFIPNIDFKAHTLEEFYIMIKNWHLTILEVCYDHCFIYDPMNIGKKMYKDFKKLYNAGKIIRGKNYWIKNL